MTFSINTLIREVRAEQPTFGVDAITDLVLPRIPPEAVMVALRQCLRNTVSGIFTSSTDERAPIMSPVPVDTAPVPDSTRSRKTRLKRAWAASLEVQIRGAQENKPFGDFTLDDCRYAVKTREQRAAVELEHARSFEQWADLLLTHQVARVRDLPESVLRSRLEGKS